MQPQRQHPHAPLEGVEAREEEIDVGGRVRILPRVLIELVLEHELQRRDGGTAAAAGGVGAEDLRRGLEIEGADFEVRRLRGDVGEGVGGRAEAEPRVEDGVGDLELAQGGLEELDVGGLGEEEGEDGDAGAAGDGAAPAQLGGPHRAGFGLRGLRHCCSLAMGLGLDLDCGEGIRW